ncbi:MAG: pyridoxal-phosphate dependent enzyme [Candidatus Heimdallarchaeota archaeon]|nr:pyridoxal-phosphate dependent enzyme [Candidatus Heimdallarchaeota archaeon]
MKKFENIAQVIGNTPIVKINLFTEFRGNYYVKLESFNPGGSSKDRIAVSIIDDAEKTGLLKPGSVIIEATSGNTGLGLAIVGITRGYRVILVMPDKMSPEKMYLVKALGCEVYVCPTEVEPDDPQSYYSVSARLVEETENSFYANQYYNEANPAAHYETTGPEIWEQTEGKVTHFIAGAGTGGTLSGTAKFLKEKNPDIKIIGIDPLGSILAYYHKYRTTDGSQAKTYLTEGVGEDIIPSNVHFDLIDDFITVSDQQSMTWTRKIALKEGILVGPSSGMVLAGCYDYASKIEDKNALIVLLLPDTGERYLTKVFSDSWMRSHGFIDPARSLKQILDSKSANLPPIISLNGENTLANALMKIQKFRIEVLLIELDDKIKYLTNYDIYNQLLQGKEKSIKLKNFELRDLNSISIDASLDELKSKIIEDKQVIVKDGDNIIGIITMEDVIENMFFD